VVTGSRITSAGFEAPSPVTVIKTDDMIQRAPGTIADALNQLPAFQNSINQNQQQFANANRQRGGNYLNLRALGTQRVLVLQDGQRLPPSGNNGGVDTNLIPQLLTERVDIVTGGASAAYGSDAVSGVVNFVLAKRFEGIKAQAQGGIATGGYGASYRAGIAVGKALLDDRLHIIASAERYHIDMIGKTSMPEIGRSFLAVGSGTAADPFRYLENVRTTGAPGGLTQNGPAGFIRKQFAPNGELIDFDLGTPSGRAGTQIGGDGTIQGQECCTITPSATTNQLFARAEYDLTSSLSLYASIGYNFADNRDQPGQLSRSPTTIFRENAYLTPTTLALLGNTASFTINRTFVEHGPNTVEQESKSLVITAGLKGKLGNLSWNVGYVHGDTRFSSTSLDTLNQNFFAAVDAVRDPASGRIVCRVSLTNPGLYPGCVPINILGVGNITPEALAYISSYSEWRVRNTMDSVQAAISGDLFSGWAGPISFALGAEYRHQSLLQTSNADPAVTTSFTGLRGVAASAMNKYFILNNGIGAGSYNIKEAFAELNVPVFRDSAVGSLSLNGAGRITDYSTSGTVVTWKAGALFDPVEGVRFRLTRSRDIRAPTLYELFAGQTITRLGFPDKLTGQTANTQSISGGNPDLKPEVANTLTVGMVFRPAFIPGFNLSVDYFNIHIDQAIGVPFTAFQLPDLCAASNYTSPLCDQIIRPLGPNNPDPSNTPTAILVTNQNLTTFNTSGIDFELRYQFPLGAGKMTVQGLATRLLSANQQNAPGEPVREFLGTADQVDSQFPVIQPKWRGNLSLTYETGPLTLSVQERIIGGYKRSKQLVYEENDIGPVAYTDLSAVLRLRHGEGDLELFGTVNNLFNREAPIIPVSNSPGLTVPTIRSAYDIIGTYVTLGLRLKY